MHDVRKVDVMENILDENDHIAEHIKEHMRQHGIMVINEMGSPGAGKTTVLKNLIQNLNEMKTFVIEGDIESDIDTVALQDMGIQAVQINTFGACHLDAPMIDHTLDHMDFGQGPHHDHDQDHDHHHHHDHDHDHEHCDHDHDHEHEHCHHDHDHDHEHCHHEHEHDENCTCGCHDHDHHGHHHADEVFTSWGMETPAKYTKEDISSYLEQLEDEKTYGFVLRAKGMVPAEDGSWIYFDYVPGESDVRTGVAQTTGKFCVIGSKLVEEHFAELFAK